MELFLIFTIWLVLGAATAYLANQRGRDPFLWSMGILSVSLFGFPFAVIGLAFLYFLPSLEDEAQNEAAPEVSWAQETGAMSKDEIQAKQWFFYDSSRQQHGPLSFKEFEAAWKDGSLTPESYVWAEGMDGWKQVISMPELMYELSKALAKTIKDLE
jgi:hypothetical protein